MQDFARADREGENLVLETVGTYGCFGIGMRLVRPETGEVLGRWTLERPIGEMRNTHVECAEILARVCEDHGVEHVYVSSLVGQSLDVFRLGIPATRIHHDYSPYCPAFYITKGGVCTTCTRDDLEECSTWPTTHRPRNSADYYLDFRDRLFETYAASNVTHVIPSPSVAENLLRLDPRFAAFEFEVVEHGIGFPRRDSFGGGDDDRRLRVGILGVLSWNKGEGTLRRRLDTWRAIADLHLIGAHDPGTRYGDRWGTRFLHSYDIEELPAVLDEHRLDLTIFLSRVPETFSYTLSESWCHGIPPAARRIGAHADRISHGVDGFLFGLEDDDVVDFLLWADRERGALREVASRIRARPIRTPEEVVADYYRLRARSPVESPVDARVPSTAEP